MNFREGMFVNELLLELLTMITGKPLPVSFLSFKSLNESLSRFVLKFLFDLIVLTDETKKLLYPL